MIRSIGRGRSYCSIGLPIASVLFAHPESRREHAHTVCAFLMLPPLTLLYLAEPAGLYLWLGLHRR